MILQEKGPVLPRGLTSLDRVYLAPVADASGSNSISVAVRDSRDEIFLSEFSAGDVQSWAESEAVCGLDILEQLHFVENLGQYQNVIGLEAPVIMGIVNVTPDSFSDGGLYHSVEAAVEQAGHLKEAGAHILDIGGESTRPGAAAVSSEEEISRVLPVIEGCSDLGLLISIDTRKSNVMNKAITSGAGMINDVTALEYDLSSLKIAVEQNVPVCLMHSFAAPDVMQDDPKYDHVLFDVIDYLQARIHKCLDAGLQRSQIIVDPGIGFGKTMDHNLILLKGLRFFHSLGCPVMLGVSRKSFISKVDRPSEAKDRVSGSLAALLYGLAAGVQIFRVHDVAQTRQAINVWQSIDKSDLTL